MRAEPQRLEHRHRRAHAIGAGDIAGGGDDAAAAALPEGLHLTARQAGQHAARAGVGQLVLTHLVPWNDSNRTLDEAGQGFAGPLCLAAPGLGFVLD